MVARSKTLDIGIREAKLVYSSIGFVLSRGRITTVNILFDAVTSYAAVIRQDLSLKFSNRRHADQEKFTSANTQVRL